MVDEESAKHPIPVWKPVLLEAAVQGVEYSNLSTDMNLALEAFPKRPNTSSMHRMLLLPSPYHISYRQGNVSSAGPDEVGVVGIIIAAPISSLLSSQLLFLLSFPSFQVLNK
jgi:hypothetical protein